MLTAAKKNISVFLSENEQILYAVISNDHIGTRKTLIIGYLGLLWSYLFQFSPSEVKSNVFFAKNAQIVQINRIKNNLRDTQAHVANAHTQALRITIALLRSAVLLVAAIAVYLKSIYSLNKIKITSIQFEFKSRCRHFQYRFIKTVCVCMYLYLNSSTLH